jgi:hypothetical protein
MFVFFRLDGEYLTILQRAFKDSEIYTMRFQQCLTRSMTLIKIYFGNHINAITQEVADKVSGKKLGETALHALLYTKFASQAEDLRLLLVELEKRAAADPDEYASLLEECYATWFGARSALVADSLADEVKQMDPYATEIVRLVRGRALLTTKLKVGKTRAGCAHLRSVCVAEWSLFGQFFSQAGEGHI